MNAEPLRGRIALVTGAARGLGREIARQLAEEGAEVWIAARDLAQADALADALQREGHVARGLKLDVTSEIDRTSAYELIDTMNGHLDILINNAAVYLDSENAITPASKLASEASEELLRATFEANFFAPIFLTQRLLPLMRRAPAARIVNLSSIRGSLTHQADPSSPVFPNKAVGCHGRARRVYIRHGTFRGRTWT